MLSFYLVFNFEGLLLPMMLYLNLSFILFVIGLVGIVWNKQNFLIMLICIELMFFSLSLCFIFISLFTYNYIGQTLSLLIVSVAAAETAIGLSLLVISYRLGNKVNYNSLITLKG